MNKLGPTRSTLLLEVPKNCNHLTDFTHLLNGLKFIVVSQLMQDFTLLLKFNNISAKVNEQLLEQPQSNIFVTSYAHLAALQNETSHLICDCQSLAIWRVVLSQKN